MIYLAENATEFTAEEMCHDIIPAMLKAFRASGVCKIGGEYLVDERDIISLICTILRGFRMQHLHRRRQEAHPQV